ncbi:MAG: BrnT family toxin [Chloroflexi bacterium]|nr:BrnT family toxin [Chloroflexota bacterium]
MSRFDWDQADPDHSGSEERLRVIGWSPIGRLLVVIGSASGPRPRIISARRATKRERHAYIDRRS